MKAAVRTPLYDLHRKLGARITQFAGFEMPVSYSGIIQEHLAVRNAAGLFDVSHMGEFEIAGEHALELLERTLTNSAAKLVVGQAQYTLMCQTNGGTIDDLIVYRVEERRYLMCVNAGNIAADREWLIEHNSQRAEFRDISEQKGLLALQGPKALSILQTVTKVPVGKVARFKTASGDVAGVQTLIAHTGYTGEDGFELFVDAKDARGLFEALLDAGKNQGLLPCGLGARDTLRLEAGLPLYGHELDRETSPIEAGLGRFVVIEREFIGAAAMRSRLKAPSKNLIGLQTDDGKSIARQGYRIFSKEAETGAITSGSYAPSFERPLAMAYAKVALKAGQPLEVGIRNRRVAATVVQLPFYRRKAHSAAS